MRAMRDLDGVPFVALRKESVDRNDILATSAAVQLMSLSARRAWIEIFLRAMYHKL